MIGQTLGIWRVEERIGGGGSGDVYRVVRVSDFRQTAAIKILREEFAGAGEQARMRGEIETLAALQHPNVARFFDHGELPDGRPWVAMELVEGTPLDVYLNENALDIRGRLELFLVVLSAVEYIHRNMILHLDLKPANILISRDGRPKIVDFGSARAVSASPAARSDDFLSRPWASPEQVLPGSRLSTSSDVYALGAVLYELLTGHTLLDNVSSDSRSLSDRIRFATPPNPAEAVRPRFVAGAAGQPVLLTPEKIAAMRGTTVQGLQKQLKGALGYIVLQALRKEPERRYPSVSEFARDVDRYLNGRSVHARPDGLAYSAVRTIRTRPMWFMAAGLAVCSVIGSFSIVTSYNKAAAAAEMELRPVTQQLASIADRLEHQIRPRVAALPGRSEAVRLLDTVAEQSREMTWMEER